MSRVKHVSFEELAGNLADILNEVRTEHTSIVVEYAGGEKLLIKPYSPSRPNVRRKQSDGAALVANTPSPQNQPDPEINPQNVSSVGAVYELDPDSITPG